MVNQCPLSFANNRNLKIKRYETYSTLRIFHSFQYQEEASTIASKKLNHWAESEGRQVDCSRH